MLELAATACQDRHDRDGRDGIASRISTNSQSPRSAWPGLACARAAPGCGRSLSSRNRRGRRSPERRRWRNQSRHSSASAAGRRAGCAAGPRAAAARAAKSGVVRSPSPGISPRIGSSPNVRFVPGTRKALSSSTLHLAQRGERPGVRFVHWQRRTSVSPTPRRRPCRTCYRAVAPLHARGPGRGLRARWTACCSHERADLSPAVPARARSRRPSSRCPRPAPPPR